MDSQYLFFYKPRTINGGAKGNQKYTSGQIGTLTPPALQSDLVDGADKRTKFFPTYAHDSNIPLVDAYIHHRYPTPADDRKYLGLGTQTDTTVDIEIDPPIWCGSGQLNVDLVGGETSIEIAMEGPEGEFIPGGQIFISDAFRSGQTVDDGSVPGRPKVKVGDWVTYNIDGKWQKAVVTDYIYPNGIFIGGGIVMSFETGVSNETYITLDEKKTVDENIGTPNGTPTPPLSNLLNIDKGLIVKRPYQAVISTSASGGTIQLSAYIDSNGYAVGNVSSGQINPATGEWVTDITWTATPDADILITYYDKNFSYIGNVATIECQTNTASFLAANTFVSAVIYQDEIKAEYENLVINSTSGTILPENVIPHNAGAEYEIITLTWISASDYNVSGSYSGALGSGISGVEFTATNPQSGKEMFRVTTGSGFLAGDTVLFNLIPASMPMWSRQIIPAGASEISLTGSIITVRGI